MTPERARELFALSLLRSEHSVPWAPGQAPTTARGGYIYSSTPELHEDPRGMTQTERKDVVKCWCHMPGDRCFMDALNRIANPEDEFEDLYDLDDYDDPLDAEYLEPMPESD